ncbi:MAG: PcfJ domain-containing protein, partial [Planctomycetota bacterium]
TSVRWGQAMADGAGKSLAEALARSRMGRGVSTPDREAFYAEYIRWLVAEPKDGFFDVDRVDPVLDYLLTQKFGMAEDVHDGGDGMEAEQPNLSLKGRRLVRVLALTDAWHDELRGPIDQVDRKTLKLRWNPAPVPGLRIVEGDGENRKLVTITQLVTAADLIAEGRAMHHCVASYISTCQSGRSAIFSMRIASGFDELKRALTIEVAPGTREIWQARGRFNELPTKAEDRFLSRWAANIGVKIRGK